MRFAVLVMTVVFPSVLAAQLVPAGQPVPKGPNPPVVFVNGYQVSCAGVDFAATFTAADKLLQANSIVSLFFDNCTVPAASGKPSVETLGASFGQYLAALKYTDGTPVSQVDVVAHSMGGLIVRSYLAGKQNGAPAVFTPPATPGIRRIIFLATPHFGTPVASAAFGSDAQASEMIPGSQFLFDLNTWNQGTDDLRGIPAIAVVGNGGTEIKTLTGFDDGVVALTSSSLSFYRTGVTRILPDCHTATFLLQLAGYCAASTPVINNITNDTTNPVSRILVSFLTGTDAWQSVGQAAEANITLAGTSGLNVQLRDQNDQPVALSGASVAVPGGTAMLPANPSSAIVAAETLPAGKLTLQISPASGPPQTASVDLTGSAGTALSAIVKAGPMISPKGVIPAAGPAPFPYDVAPGAYVSIYGTSLSGTTSSATQPYPMQIGDVQVLVNGTAQPLVYVSPGQINFVYANSAPGLTQLTVKNMSGQHTVNVRVAPATPAIFLLDANATAAAVNALPATIVSKSAPLHAGDFLSLYLTGLGATMKQDALDYAQIQPTVTLGGQSCAVTYAGRSPGFAGLDQINCKVAPGVAGTAVPVIVTSNGRVSNTAFVAIQ